MVFLTLFAAKITADNTKNDPKLAAMAVDQLEREKERKKPPKTEDPKINNATPKLAPEEIPNTKGPASGFLNKVCINKPLIANPEPTKTAVIALGNLTVKIISCQLPLTVSSPKIIAIISFSGIETEPKLILVNQSNIRIIPRNKNCF